MYRAEVIKEKFLNLLGWRNHHNPVEYTIKEYLTKSETGQYYQDIHPLLTLDNIRSISPEFDKENYDEHLSEWLKNKTQASILKAVESFYSRKLADKTAANILERKVLFDGAGRMSDVVRNTNSIVGFEIIPIRAEGVTLKIEKIGLQFTKNAEIPIYLYHSSRKYPLKEIRTTYDGEGSIKWIEVNDFYLPYMGEDTDAGGSWFLCYDQSNLPGEAIQKNRDWSKEPCRSCSSKDFANWQAWSKYLEIHPFKVPSTHSNKIWDISDNLYTYTTNYGINLQVSIECDLTDIIVAERRAFQNVIGLQLAADIIREFAYNPNFRINRMQQNFSRNELLYELDGDSQGYKKSGIMHRLEKAMEALSVDTTGINRICLPCKSEGIRYRTI